MSGLHHLERPADGPPRGLLVLHHGRGADEHDLLPLADLLDPRRRLHVVTPRAPLTLPDGPGRHWYLPQRVGHPEPETYRASVAELAALHDELAERFDLGPERTILGGFSQGAVMSYGVALDAARPAPAGIIALSGFIPTIPGWAPSLEDRRGTRVWLAHGVLDAVIPVEFGRRAREVLATGPLPVEYREFHGAHHLDPRSLPELADWIERTVAD